jgi:uncharacterized protein (DUF433 family)
MAERKNASLDELIVTDPNVMGGRQVFRGTRVPVDVVFENLADGMSLDDILNEYETLNREDVVRVLELAPEAFSKPHAA